MVNDARSDGGVGGQRKRGMGCGMGAVGRVWKSYRQMQSRGILEGEEKPQQSGRNID